MDTIPEHIDSKGLWKTAWKTQRGFRMKFTWFQVFFHGLSTWFSTYRGSFSMLLNVENMENRFSCSSHAILILISCGFQADAETLW